MFRRSCFLTTDVRVDKGRQQHVSHLHNNADVGYAGMILCSIVVVVHVYVCMYICTHPQGNNTLSVSAKGTDLQLISNLLDELKALV